MKIKLKNRVATALAVGALVLGGSVLAASPAMAWSSTATDSSPDGCWGGFSGSSAPNYPSSGQMYVSVGNNGSSCWAWVDRGAISANWRNSSNAQVATGCATTSTFCSSTRSLLSSAAGGVHTWKSVLIRS